MSEQLEPLATEAGQQAIVRAINNLSSLENAVRAEHAATQAAQSADDALTSATNASNSQTKARDWAEKTSGAVETETIVTPPETEGDPPTEELVSYFSAKYWAQMAEDYLNQMVLDTVPTEDSTNGITSGAVYDALATKQDTLTFDSSPTQSSDNPVKSGGVYTALAGKQDTLTIDSTPTQNSTNPVQSGGIYTALSSKADSSSVPTKVSDLTNDSGFITGVAWNDVTSKPTFATVATSGSYNDLSNTPTIPTVPTKVSDLTNDTGFITGVSWSDVTSKPTFATVATSGSYTDLTDKPTIPSAYTLPTASSSTLGGIKVGTNLSIDNNGVLSASGGSNVTVDSSITENSTNPVTSAAIYAALQNVSPAITIDSSVTESSTNPVTSAGIYDAIENAVGAGSLASGMQITELFNDKTNGWNSGILTLFDRWDKFDFIYVVWSKPDEGFNSTLKTIEERIIPVSYLTEIYNMQARVVLTGYSTRHFYFSLPDGKQSFSLVNTTDCKLWQVYGIKFSKNLSEQMYSNVLYENSSLWSSGSVVLSDTIDNYDFLCFETTSAGYTQFSSQQILRAAELLDTSHTYFNLYENGSRSFEFTVSSDKKTLNCTRTDQGLRVRKIIGIKMAKGGYSGIVSDARMTVKSGFLDLSSGVAKNVRLDYPITFDSPMVDTSYVVNTTPVGFADYFNSLALTVTNKTTNGFTISGWLNNNNIPATQGFGISWIVIRPNSYTREGMVEDILFSNASGVNSGTINLSGNISDYDLIEVRIGKSGADNNSCIFTSSYVQAQTSSSKTVQTRYNASYINWYCGSDNSIVIPSAADGCLIYKITGIKFGRYVSGVAVDTTVTQNSSNVITSGAVYTALQSVGGGSSITVDSSVTQNSSNAVSSGAVYTAIQTAISSITNANGVSY